MSHTPIDYTRYEGHHSGAWGWFGQPGVGFYLATQHSGRQYVMAFERMGMRSAQPTFQRDGLMVPGSELCRFEVAPDVIGVTAAKATPRVYRTDISEFDHPDARLIEDAPVLLARCQELDAINADLLEALEAWMEYAPHAGVWTEEMYQEFADLRHKAYVAIAKAKGEK